MSIFKVFCSLTVSSWLSFYLKKRLLSFSFSILKFSLLLVLLFSLSSCFHLRKQDHEKALLHLQNGKSFLKEREYPTSLKHLLIARDLYPTYPEIHNTLGLIYFVMRKYTLAETSFRQSLELDSNYTEARKNLGKLLLVSGYTDKAIIELSKASEDLTYPYPEEVALNLGIAYFHQANYEKAEKNFALTLKQKTKSCDTHIYYGRALFEQKSYKEAISAFKRIYKICSKRKKNEIFYYSALSYVQLNQFKTAKSFLNKIVKNKEDKALSKKAEDILKLLL